MPSVLEQLAALVVEWQDAKMCRSQWIGDDCMKVYVRKARHKCGDHGLLACLDIGSIEVFEPGQGAFSQWFLPGAVKLNPWEAIFVESVMDRRFQEFFERNGFTRLGDEPLCLSYFLLKSGDESPVFKTRKH